MKSLILKTSKLITDLIYNVDVVGDKNVFKQERLLIIANHPSFLDGILLGLYLPVKPVFLVHTTVKDRPIFRQFAKLVDTFEVDPYSPYAIKSIIRLLESGRPVVIFPEGRLTVTGGLMKVYPGAAFAAAKTNATVVTMTIDGAEFSKVSRLQSILPTRYFPKITLTINPPFKLAMPETGSAKVKRAAMGEEMRKHLQFALFNKSKPKSLFNAFLSGMSTFGENTPIVEDVKRPNKPYTYGELFESIQGLRVLLRDELDSEKRIGMFLPNVSTAITTIYALNAENKTPCLLNYTSGYDSLHHAISVTPIKKIITSRVFIESGGYTDLIKSLVETVDGLNIIYLEDLKAKLTTSKKIKIWSMIKSKKEVNPEPNSEAIILYTSGSEGKPKGVVHTNESIIANVWQIRSIIDFTPKDKVLMCLPLFHSFGLNTGAIFPLVSGVSLMLYPSPLHYKVIPELIYDKNCTILFGTNTFLAQYAKQAHNYDFARVRYVIAGAEKLSDTTREVYLDKFGIRIFEGYGLTETAPVLAVNTPMAYKKGSVGQFVPSVKYYLEKVDGIENGGALYVQAPNLMKGYLLNSPEIVPASDIPENECYKTNIVHAHEAKSTHWFKTGDIVDIDMDGFVFIKGRMKRFAKIAGEMVSLETTERIAKNAKPDFEHAVISTPDEKKGEMLILFTTDAELSRDKLLSSCKELGHSELAMPKQIKFLDKLPLLGTGKIDYVSLKNLMSYC